MKKSKSTFCIGIVLLQFAIVSTLFAGNPTFTNTDSKIYFSSAKTELNDMLSGKIPLSYERAIFLIENAYWGNQIDPLQFSKVIDFHIKNIQSIIEASRDYSKADFRRTLLESEEQKKIKYEKALTNWAIFTYLTDTTHYIRNNKFYYNPPLKYSTNDPLGTIDWRTTQILNLMEAQSGNCFALVSLYKILSERLKSEAIICTAPGHIYIRHADIKGIYYNVELATRSFPGTGTLETLTYTTDDGTKNRISLRELDLKQSVALCLIYLAKGYEYKFNTKADDFILQCSELALRYDSLNLNALLLKSEVLEERVIAKNKSISQLQKDNEFQQYENLISHIYKLGYREMPIEMKNFVIAKLRGDSTAMFFKDHTPQPFTSIGVKENRYATLSWGVFDEMHEWKPYEQYQRTIFATKKNKISKFVVLDTTYNNYPIDMVVFAWSIDPLTHKFSSESPYIAFGDNPIRNIDVDGAYKYPADQAAAYKKDYPLITKYLAQQVHADMMNSTVILNAYSSSTGGNLTAERVSEMTTWTQGPEIRFVDEPTFPQAGGKGRYEPFGDYIELRIDDAAALEKILASDKSDEEKMAAFLPFYKTLGHETTHAGNYVDFEKVVKEGEVGYEYDNKVYGKQGVFDPYSETIYNPEVTKKVIDEQNKTKEGKETLPTLPKKYE